MKCYQSYGKVILHLMLACEIDQVHHCSSMKSPMQEHEQDIYKARSRQKLGTQNLRYLHTMIPPMCMANLPTTHNAHKALVPSRNNIIAGNHKEILSR